MRRALGLRLAPPLDASGRLGQGLRLQGICPPRSTACPAPGTDKTKRWIETPAPVVILVEPQLGENIGAAARAMANFGLSRLRLVKPRDGWPNRARLGDGVGRRPRPRRRRAVRHASRRRSPTALSCSPPPRARTTRPSRWSAPRGGGGADGAAGRGRRDRRAWCSGASATGSRTTRSRSPTASSRCRSIRPSPRSIWRRRCVIVAYEWFKLAARRRAAVRDAAEVDAGDQASSCSPSSPISSASSSRSNSSARPTSATPC